MSAHSILICVRGKLTNTRTWEIEEIVITCQMRSLMSVYCMITQRGEPKHRGISKGRRNEKHEPKKDEKCRRFA
jgi:hypothetical protein